MNAITHEQHTESEEDRLVRYDARYGIRSVKYWGWLAEKERSRHPDVEAIIAQYEMGASSKEKYRDPV